jgi:hypothetical protein
MASARTKLRVATRLAEEDNAKTMPQSRILCASQRQAASLWLRSVPWGIDAVGLQVNSCREASRAGIVNHR